jgi:heparan-alpha-glucosaminide N-acetyltransferase
MDTVAVPAATSPEVTKQETAVPPSPGERCLALDTFRGFIMLILVSEGFGLAGLAKHNPASIGLANQFDHHPWQWIAFWDLIQPAFMFMVGVAMPFALARRLERGATRSHFSGTWLDAVSGCS